MDDQLLAQAQTIDNYTLSSIMDDYGNDVWNYAYFLTKSAEQADELSQEVFIRAYSGIAHYRGDCSLKTWLLTITRNTTFTYRKSRFFAAVCGERRYPLRQSVGIRAKESWLQSSLHILRPRWK